MAQDDSWFEAFLRDIDNANGPTDFDEFARTIEQDATDIELGIWQQNQEQQDQDMMEVADEPHPVETESSNGAITPVTDLRFPARQQLPFGQRPPEGQEGWFEYRSLFADMAPIPQPESVTQPIYPVDIMPLRSITPPRQEPPLAQSVPLADHDQSEYAWIFADQAPESLFETHQPIAQTPCVEPPPMLDPTELALLQAFNRPLEFTPEPAQSPLPFPESAQPPQTNPRPTPAECFNASNLISGTWNISVRIVLQELKKHSNFRGSNFECAKVLKKIWPEQFPDAMTDANFSRTISMISVEQVNVEGKRWELMDLVGEDHEWRVQVREMLRGLGVV